MNYTEEELGRYTPEERVQLSKKVIALQDIYYGGQQRIVEKTMTGIIQDFGRTSGDPCIQWCNGVYGIAELGINCAFVEYRGSIEYILDNLLSSIVKAESAPCSSYTHLAQAVDALYKIAGDYVASTDEHKEELANALEHIRLLRGS